MPEVTVLVNTFNRREYLRRVIVAFGRQTSRDFEMVVADDGSSDGTPAMVGRMVREVGFPLRLVTHPRRGHRRTRILNEGIRASEGKTILFTDCDSLPRSDLVAVHLRRRERKRMLVGGYLRLSREVSQALDLDAVREGRYEEALDEEAIWNLRLEDLKIRMYLALGRKRRPHNMGLNYSAWREDLLEVNGYDETFRGWGNADGDVRDRLREMGVLPKSVWTEALIFHMWHPPQRSKYAYVAGRKTRNALWARRPRREPRCLNGIEKLPGWREELRLCKSLVTRAVAAEAREKGRRTPGRR
jgi:glycosyltransferase involved in cell wall biosynthesis